MSSGYGGSIEMLQKMTVAQSTSRLTGPAKFSGLGVLTMVKPK